MTLEHRRQYFAEEIEAVANLKSAPLVEALAAIPRERFLKPGPWFVRGEGDITGGRQTPDSDPRHVYHNYSIAIDPARQLFNGAPGVVCGAIDALRLERTDRVLHVGAGLGYYSALMAHVVGPSGHVVASEVDLTLAHDAALQLREMPWVDVHGGESKGPFEGPFDAILVNTGVTHPLDTWLDALGDHGRMIVPITASIPAMGPISKGVMVLVTRHGQDEYEARVLTFAAIYTAVGIRDAAMNDRIGQALMRTPFPRLQRLRRDRHEPGPGCWVHGDRICLALD